MTTNTSRPHDLSPSAETVVPNRPWSLRLSMRARRLALTITVMLGVSVAVAWWHLPQIDPHTGLWATANTVWAAAAAPPPGDNDDDDQPRQPVVYPGLVQTLADGTNQTWHVVETPAFAVNAGESLSPVIAPVGLTARWHGVVMIPRERAYTFAVRVVGGHVVVRVGGAVVVEADGSSPPTSMGVPGDVCGAPVKLPAGPAELVIEFARTPGQPAPLARLGLFWECVGSFPREPIPPAVLAHKPDQFTTQIANMAGLDPRGVTAGRHLAEEYNCTACHKPTNELAKVAAGLNPRVATALNKISGHVQPAWLYHWLGDPQGHRPASPMPALFTDDPTGQTQRWAATQYLMGLAAPKPGPAPKGSVDRGRELFTAIGCVVCHQGANTASAKGPAPEPDRTDLNTPGHATIHGVPLPGVGHIPLVGLGTKFAPDALVRFLRNPADHNPATRMPHMLLSDKEAADIAVYLLSQRNSAYDKAPLPKPPPDAIRAAWEHLTAPQQAIGLAATKAAFGELSQDQQTTALGRAVVVARQCVSCHQLNDPAVKTHGGLLVAAPARSLSEIAGRTLARLAAESSGAREPVGCLEGGAGAPRFVISPPQRTALQTWLTALVKAPTATVGAGAAAPLAVAADSLTKLNCLGCHARNGRGGLDEAVLESLRRYEKPENAESVVPPAIGQVGHKIQIPWLAKVFTEGLRSRPWMSLRMPQYGKAHVAGFHERIAALDGVIASDTAPPVEFDPQAVKDGRALVGKSGLGCISCHYIAGRPSVGTMGPDLAMVGGRLHRDWYDRWMWDPQRMAPGTRMPTIHIDGRSGLKTIADGHAPTQIAAMWNYMSLGAGLPLPDGLETAKPIGLTLTPVAGRAMTERVFLPECGERAIAVGFAEGVSFGFDAQRCRVGMAWSGAFLDMEPVWASRGGRTAKLLGTPLWTFPPGFPWRATASPSTVPDFASTADDLTLNASPWLGEPPQTPRRLRFVGYSLSDSSRGEPTFRYRLTPGDPAGEVISFAETVAPISRISSVGLSRRFAVQSSAGQGGEQRASSVVWMVVAQLPAKQTLRVWSPSGSAPVPPREQPRPEAGWGTLNPAAEHVISVADDTDRPLLLAVTEAPPDTAWVIQTLPNGEQMVLVRLPAFGQTPDKPHVLRIEISRLLRSQPEVLAAAIAELGRD